MVLLNPVIEPISGLQALHALRDQRMVVPGQIHAPLLLELGPLPTAGGTRLAAEVVLVSGRP